jgi:hypothetical protein
MPPRDPTDPAMSRRLGPDAWPKPPAGRADPLGRGIDREDPCGLVAEDVARGWVAVRTVPSRVGERVAHSVDAVVPWLEVWAWAHGQGGRPEPTGSQAAGRHGRRGATLT